MSYIMEHPEMPGQPITVRSEAGIKEWETSGWKLAKDQNPAGSESNVVYPSKEVYPSDTTTPAPATEQPNTATQQPSSAATGQE